MNIQTILFTVGTSNRMTIEQYLYRLCQKHFLWAFRLAQIPTTRSYFGRDLCVTPLHVSYGQIGYTIHFPYSRDQCPNSHMIGKWTNSPSMRKIGRNGFEEDEEDDEKNKTSPKWKSKMPTHWYICAHLGFLFFADWLVTDERRPCDLFLFCLSLLIIIWWCRLMSFASLFSSEPKLQHLTLLLLSFPKHFIYSLRENGRCLFHIHQGGLDETGVSSDCRAMISDRQHCLPSDSWSCHTSGTPTHCLTLPCKQVLPCIFIGTKARLRFERFNWFFRSCQSEPSHETLFHTTTHHPLNCAFSGMVISLREME